MSNTTEESKFKSLEQFCSDAKITEEVSISIQTLRFLLFCETLFAYCGLIRVVRVVGEPQERTLINRIDRIIPTTLASNIPLFRLLRYGVQCQPDGGDL